MKAETKVCPVCKESNQVIRIIYGEPSESTMDEAKRGEVKLGGCCVSVGCNRYHCKRCNHDF